MIIGKKYYCRDHAGTGRTNNWVGGRPTEQVIESSSENPCGFTVIESGGKIVKRERSHVCSQPADNLFTFNSEIVVTEGRF